MAKEKKPRTKEYDTKLAINGSFEDVIKVSVTPSPKKSDTDNSPEKGKQHKDAEKK